VKRGKSERYEYDKLYRELNEEHIRETNKERYWTDPELSRAKNREYYRANREKILSAEKQKRKDNPEKEHTDWVKQYARRRDKKLAYQREYDRDHSEAAKARKRKYYWKHRETILEQKRTLAELWKEVLHDRRRESRYGITRVDYDNTMAVQSSGCAICNRKTKLVVDHNHATGAVRALLCNKCNLLIGTSGESTILLVEMINYLNKHNCSSVQDHHYQGA
jgi:hypothetical protein